MDALTSIIIVMLTASLTWVTLGLIFVWQKLRERKKKYKNFENEYGDI